MTLDETSEGEGRIRTLLANINDSVTVVDAAGTVIDGTGFFDTLLGYPNQYWSERSVWELTDPEQLPELIERYQWVIDHPGEKTQFDLRLRTSEGGWEYIELTAVNLLHDPSIEGIVLTSRNVSDRKALEHDLATQRDRAIEEARLRSEFTARASHELRNQVHALAGLSELVGSADVPEDVRHLADQARRTASRLQHLVDNLLEFSRVRAGEHRLRPTAVDTAHLLDDAVAIGRSIAPRAVEVRARIHHGAPACVTLDEAAVGQVLANLVGNAAKFTDTGSVIVEVAATTLGAAPATRFAVIDTGRGIEEADLARVFEAFEQSSPGDRNHGAGLGLSICAELVELLGGSIEVESTPQEGSTFTVVVPVAACNADESTRDDGTAGVTTGDTTGTSADRTGNDTAPAATAGTAGTAAEAPSRVLVVEDNPVNQMLVKEQLRRLGADVTVVGDGQAAVATATTEGPWDLILMDWQLPGLDGLEATRRIRAAGTGSRPTPIVGITASARVGDRRVCLDAGMDDVLTKPASFAQLAEAVELHVRSAGVCRPDAGGDNRDHEALDALAAEIGVEPVRSIVTTWLEELDSRVEAVLRGVRESDAEMVRRSAHRLRATSRTLGAIGVDDSARALEQGDFPPSREQIAAFEESAAQSARQMTDWLSG